MLVGQGLEVGGHPRNLLARVVHRVHPAAEVFAEKGRTLGTTQIVKRFRRATMQYRSKDGKLGNFVAIAPDTYQRVGVDREH